MCSKKKKNRLLILLALILLLPFQVYAGVSPVNTFEWEYRSICRNTIPAYLDAYEDGEKELILASLNTSETFQGLGADQQKAFLRILDFFKARLESGASIEGVIKECEANLEHALSSLNYSDHLLCSDVSERVSEFIKSEGRQKIEEIRGLAYRRCIDKRIKNGRRDD